MKLDDCPDEYIRCGAVLQILSVDENRENWYRENIVDLMVFDAGVAFKDAAYGLICISGHKAGKINVAFPRESGDQNGNGLRRDWLIENWNRWVYPDGNFEDAWIRNSELAHPIPKKRFEN
ncbi:Imm45 family immunity protein [Variovorax atrisoli]|uniref:Imm45 family immunity protein n=1 Tax=Variovorax atrisoli TaxID=3394203 RepID=UPI00339A8D55